MTTGMGPACFLQLWLPADYDFGHRYEAEFKGDDTNSNSKSTLPQPLHESLKRTGSYKWVSHLVDAVQQACEEKDAFAFVWDDRIRKRDVPEGVPNMYMWGLGPAVSGGYHQHGRFKQFPFGIVIRNFDGHAPRLNVNLDPSDPKWKTVYTEDDVPMYIQFMERIDYDKLESLKREKETPKANAAKKLEPGKKPGRWKDPQDMKKPMQKANVYRDMSAKQRLLREKEGANTASAQANANGQSSVEPQTHTVNKPESNEQSERLEQEQELAQAKPRQPTGENVQNTGENVPNKGENVASSSKYTNTNAGGEAKHNGGDSQEEGNTRASDGGAIDNSKYKNVDPRKYSPSPTSTPVLLSEPGPPPAPKPKVLVPGDKELDKARQQLESEHTDKWVNESVVLLKRAVNLGNTEALVDLTNIYLLGRGSVPIDFDTARDLALKLIDKEHGYGHSVIAMLYSYGLGVAEDQTKAMLHYSMAAILNDPHGTMAMAYRAKMEVMISRSCSHAHQLYKALASNVVQDMTDTGGRLSQRERINYDTSWWAAQMPLNKVSRSFQFYKWLADRDDVRSQYNVGALYLQGSFGVRKDEKKAFFYLNLAAMQGHKRATALVGNMCLRGKGTSVNYTKAHQYYKAAARKGDAVGQTGLGILYLNGFGVPQSFADAFSWFERASVQGSSDGAYHLGVMYFNGLGTPVEHEKALRSYQRAAEKGHTTALYSVGLMYSKGISVPQSCNLATDFFKAVAERGRWAEWLDRAHEQYEKGDVHTALVRYLYAAETGNEIAQHNAAWILHHNKDVVETTGWTENGTHAVAFELWRRAAEQENVHARVRMGDYYYHGLGVPRDTELALSQYRIAGSMGSVQAYFNLGTMHESGDAGEVDYHIARRNYDRAIERDPNVYLPVSLALAKLSVKEFVTGLHTSEHLSIATNEISAMASEQTDVAVMACLACLLWYLIKLRRRLYGV